MYAVYAAWYFEFAVHFSGCFFVCLCTANEIQYYGNMDETQPRWMIQKANNGIIIVLYIYMYNINVFILYM